MKIGIFDSGIGGLSVLTELAGRLPDASFIYYADSDNAPYGEKSHGAILELTSSAVSFLVGHGAQAVILACNTATAVAVKDLRERGLRVFGMEPAVNQAMKSIECGKILAAATPVTLKGEKYLSLVERIGASERAVPLPLPGLVRMAERELFGECRPSCPDAEKYIREQMALNGVDRGEIAAVVLGCTHFTFFREDFHRIFPSLPIYNGVGGTASNVIRTLGLSDESNTAPILPRTEFYISGKPADGEAMRGFCNCIQLLMKK